MTFDELQDKWQSQRSECKLNIDADHLLKEVKRNKQYFEAAIFWRDFREVGVAFVLVGVFMYFGIKDNSWGSMIMAAMCLFVGVFFIVDRVMQKHKCPKYDDSLTGCVTDSHVQISHQIWLLKNIFWWYQLPILIGAAFMTGEFGWSFRENSRMLWSSILGAAVLWGSICLGIYVLNQWCVRKELIPRKKELQEILDAVKKSDDQ